jgi:DNA-nicking Smr family endonuclease
MRPKNEEDEEAQLFLDAVKDVKRIDHRLAAMSSSTLAVPAARQIRATPGHDPLQGDISDQNAFLRNGVQTAVLRKLRRGHILIEHELDLHGCSSSEAETKVQAFIRSVRRPDRQCAVRIIHGKGLGSPNGSSVLKDKTRSWLQQDEGVLAFCQAGATTGGSGAVHVLLKKW